VETFGLKINFGSLPIILRGVCILKNVLFWGISILVIRKARFLIRPFLMGYEWKLLGYKFILEACHQSYRKFALRKIFCFGE
jgi:hypothetical protein